MEGKYKNKFRIDTARFRASDYSEDGYYLVTICCQNRKSYFGKISEKRMNLSKIGEFAESCWKEIPKHFPFVILDGFIVMPNHLHGIILIDKEHCHETKFVETQNLASLRNTKGFGPQSQNLASIIRGFKIGVKNLCRENNLYFQWQERFHDHIIRNDIELENMRRYIRDNLANWNRDRNNPDK